MIHTQLFNPKSIAVIGASNDVSKPGGNIIKNIVNSNFKGLLYAVNPTPISVQNVATYAKINDLPNTELAVICIAARHCPNAVRQLCKQGTNAFIIVSAGFSEMGEEGQKLSNKINEILSKYNACLLGPNCIGAHT